MNKYSVYLAWSDGDDGYIATSQEFPGVSAFGRSHAAALREFEKALEVAIAAYKEDGLPLPEPVLRT